MGKENLRKDDKGWVAFDPASGWESKPCKTRDEARVEKRAWKAAGSTFSKAEPKKKPKKASKAKACKSNVGTAKTDEARLDQLNKMTGPAWDATRIEREELEGKVMAVGKKATPPKKKNGAVVKGAQTITLGKRDLIISSNPEDTIIGRIFFWSVSHFEIPENKLKELCNKAGLKFNDIFYDIDRINVYKNLTNLTNCPYRNRLEHFERRDDGFYRYFVSVTSPEGKRRSGTLRWLVEEFKEHAEDKPIFKTLGKWDYNEGEIQSDCLYKKGTPECNMFGEMTKKLKMLMGKYQHIYIDVHFRVGLRRIIETCNAIPLRSSGGVYYTPEEFRQTVESMGDLMSRVAEFTQTTNTTLYTIPVVNGSQERDMLYFQFEQHVKAKSEKLLAKVEEKLASGNNVRSDFFSNVLAEAKALAKLRDQYRENLMVEFDVADFNIDALEGKLTRLFDFVGGA